MNILRKMKTVIIALIKDEHEYLKEWIDYHLSLGFTEIHLFEDYDSKSHLEITKNYSQVRLSPLSEIYHGHTKSYPSGSSAVKQTNLYNRYLPQVKKYFDWAAFIDIDEFIVIPNQSLEEFLEEYKDVSGIYLFWKLYGASGRIHKSKSIVDTYTEPGFFLEDDQYYNYKSIVNLNYQGTLIFSWSHHQIDLGVCTNKKSLEENNYLLLDKAWINHYFTKSWEDWVWRVTKRGNVTVNYRKLDGFFKVNPEMAKFREELLTQHFKENLI